MAANINAADHYLDHLDKQMTMEGIITTFCVVATAAIFDRVLGADVTKSSEILKALQQWSYPYIIAAGGALLCAGGLFFWQREDLVWVHGLISLSVTREARESGPPPGTLTVEEAIDSGDSWSIWLRHKQGLVLLGACALELALALYAGARKAQTMLEHWEISLLPFVAALGCCVWLAKHLEKRDKAERSRTEEPKHLRRSGSAARETAPVDSARSTTP